MKVGAVVIGRNEGERLERCISSLSGEISEAVYVDSGSSDGSVDYARNQGLSVVELDAETPFTMARARNAGFERLLSEDPEIGCVQFVDGDCEVVPGWIDSATLAMSSRDDVVAVCGRRRERYPESTRYNRLIDMEWEGPTGVVESCGGDVMIRARAFREIGGFNPRMIAGEEPELSVRLRRAGGLILRLADDMTLHDANIRSFRQWWRRCVRGGHAYAEGAFLHGRPPEKHKVRPLSSAVFWGGVMPIALIVSLLGAAFHGVNMLPIAAGFVFLHVIQCGRVYASLRRRSKKDRWLYAFYTMLAKFPQLLGALKFWWNRLGARPSVLIEYKGPRDGFEEEHRVAREEV